MSVNQLSRFLGIMLHLLVLFHALNQARSEQLTTEAVRDMDPTQLIGTYWNINPKTDGGIQCPDGVRVDRVETLQSESGVLYILPHRYLSLPIKGGGRTECEGTPIDSSLTTESATVLRRDTQTQLDRSDALINEFALAQERFFLGLELGARVCSQLTIANGTVSMWMAPSREISVPLPGTGLTIAYQPGSKYVYYYTDVPCVFKGDAAERGVVTAAPSMSSSRTPAPSQSRLPPGVSPDVPVASGNATASGALASPSVRPPVSPYVPGPPANIPVSRVPGLSNSSDRVCFPASAAVWVYADSAEQCDVGIECHIAPPRMVPISRLRVGHIVATGVIGERDTVIGFTHSLARVWTHMVRLTTEDNRTLVASGGHFVYIHSSSSSGCCGGGSGGDGRWESRKAEAVRVGDRLIDSLHGAPIGVVKTEWIISKGLYNPHTYTGNIVVNGFVVTTFTTAVRNAQTGHALMMPWRLLQRIAFKVFNLS